MLSPVVFIFFDLVLLASPRLLPRAENYFSVLNSITNFMQNISDFVVGIASCTATLSVFYGYDAYTSQMSQVSYSTVFAYLNLRGYIRILVTLDPFTPQKKRTWSICARSTTPVPYYDPTCCGESMTQPIAIILGRRCSIACCAPGRVLF